MVTLLVGIVLMCQVNHFTVALCSLKKSIGELPCAFSQQASNELTDDSVLLTFEDNLVDRKFSPFSKTNLRLSRQSKIELSPLRTISYSHYQRLIDVRSSTRSIDRCILLSRLGISFESPRLLHIESHLQTTNIAESCDDIDTDG